MPASRSSASRGIRSSPSTVAIRIPDTPSCFAVSTAARAAAVGLIPPAFVMTFVRPAATAGSAAARYRGQVARVSERLVRLPVLLEDRERQLGERLQAEVVDAVCEQALDGARECRRRSPARRRSGRSSAPPGQACTGGRRSAHGRGLLELRRDPEEQVLAAVRGDELRRRSAGPRRSSTAAARSPGWPVTLNCTRERHELGRRGCSPCSGFSGVGSSVPSGSGGSPSVGVSSRSKPSAHHAALARPVSSMTRTASRNCVAASPRVPTRRAPR